MFDSIVTYPTYISETESTESNMLVDSLCTKNLETSYLKKKLKENYECQLHHEGVAPYAETHIHIAAMHIKKTTSNNEDDNNKLIYRSNNEL